MEDENTSFISQFKIPLALTILSVSLIAFGIYYMLNINSQGSVTFSNPDSEASVSGKIIVHIAGEVNNPGVYSLDSGMRINDLITLAGGLTVEADNDFIQKHINLAQVINDGAKVYIPKIGEEAITSVIDYVVNPNPNAINLNTATKVDLMTLTGVGETRAQKIIDGRPYNNLNELLDRKIVPQNVFTDIKDKISL